MRISNNYDSSFIDEALEDWENFKKNLPDFQQLLDAGNKMFREWKENK
jgi:hypothetical protein